MGWLTWRRWETLPVACPLVRWAGNPKGACKAGWTAFQRMIEWRDAVLVKGTGGAQWTPKHPS